MPDQAKPYIGGQAVIEGVMMRAPTALTVAVRRPDGSLAVREAPYRAKLGQGPWKLPGFRGVASLVEALTLGMDAMSFSIDQQITEEERAKGESSGGVLTAVISVALALVLFIGTPQALALFVGRQLGLSFTLGSPLFHAIIGGFKLLVLLGYMVFLGSMEATRRVFEYHGAEHMTIHAYEQGLPLTVENVRRQTTLHPRCGTTFLVLVVLVSILVGSTVAPLVLPDAKGLAGQLMLLALRISLLPVIAGVSFELQRFTARYCTTGPLRFLLWPGFLFQKISTRRPTDDQLEVAIAAMESAAWRDRVGERADTAAEPLVFADFATFASALPTLRPERA